MGLLQNSEWKVDVNKEKGEVALYKQGAVEPVMIMAINTFKALQAIIEQVTKTL